MPSGFAWDARRGTRKLGRITRYERAIFREDDYLLFTGSLHNSWRGRSTECACEVCSRLTDEANKVAANLKLGQGRMFVNYDDPALMVYVRRLPVSQLQRAHQPRPRPHRKALHANAKWTISPITCARRSLFGLPIRPASSANRRRNGQSFCLTIRAIRTLIWPSANRDL